MQAGPPLLRTMSPWSDSLLCLWCPSVDGTVTRAKGGRDWWGSLAAFCPTLGLPLLREWAGHGGRAAQNCSSAVGLSCPGAGHVSGTATTKSKLLCFPAVLYKPSSSQTSLGAEHLQRGWSQGCSALSSPGCSCPAQRAWHSPGSHWQYFLGRGKHLQITSGSFWEMSVSKVCSLPPAPGKRHVGHPFPRAGGKAKHRAPRAWEQCPAWGHRVSPQLWGRAVLTGGGFGCGAAEPWRSSTARATQAPPSAASSWGHGVTWARLPLWLCRPSSLPNTAASPAGGWPCSVGWPCWGLAVGAVCV